MNEIIKVNYENERPTVSGRPKEANGEDREF